MEYKVITVSAASGLGTDFEKAGEEMSRIVNEALRTGWRPQGGLAVGMTPHTKSTYLLQAVVRE
jgi:hypothetical protein